jgi:hypothetical protein
VSAKVAIKSRRAEMAREMGVIVTDSPGPAPRRDPDPDLEFELTFSSTHACAQYRKRRDPQDREGRLLSVNYQIRNDGRLYVEYRRPCDYAWSLREVWDGPIYQRLVLGGVLAPPVE